MKVEMETLGQDRDFITQELDLLGRTEREDKLEKGCSKCEELEETITRLVEEQRVSSDKVLKQNSQMKSQKDKIICELYEEICELGNKNLENEQLVRVYKEKLQSVANEIKNLRHEKTVAEKTVSDLRVKISESHKATGVKNEEMLENKIILELNDKINELKNKNSANERLVLAMSHKKFQCLDANEKLKDELAELKSQLSSSVFEKEKLESRYNTLAEDHKKLDNKLMNTLSRAIQHARLEGYTQAQQQVDDQTLDELRLEKRSENLVPTITKQNGSKGLRGSGPNATDMGKIAYAQTKKKQYRTRGGSPIRSSPKRKKRKYISDNDDDILPTDEKRNPVLESDSEDETFSPGPNEGDHDISSEKPEPKMHAAKLPCYSIHQSIISPNHVRKLRESMGIPPEYEIVIPSPEDRPDHPPPGFLCFFFHQLNCGLRFPIQPLFTDISRLFNISLCQLTPNSFLLMAGFAMVVLYLGEIPTARLFRSYYQAHYKDEGVFYFSSSGEARFLKGCPKSKQGWKELYFYISSPQPWNFPTIWRDTLPKMKKNYNVNRDPAFESLLERLNQNPYDLSRLVEPNLLYHFGLSPLREELLKPIGEIMAENLMEEEAVDASHRRRRVGSSSLPPKHPDEAAGTTLGSLGMLEEVD